MQQVDASLFVDVGHENSSADGRGDRVAKCGVRET